MCHRISGTQGASYYPIHRECPQSCFVVLTHFSANFFFFFFNNLIHSYFPVQPRGAVYSYQILQCKDNNPIQRNTLTKTMVLEWFLKKGSLVFERSITNRRASSFSQWFSLYFMSFFRQINSTKICTPTCYYTYP